MGTKISEATLREILKGSESLPIVDTDLPKGRTTIDILKSYVKPDMSGYAEKTGAEFTGTIAAPIVAFMRESKGMMAAIQADSNNILFRTYNAGVDSITFQVQSSMPLKITEAGIWENNQLLENKYAKIDDVPNVSTLATKEEVNAKLSTDTYNADKATFATKTELGAKQDALVSGTNIKTVNGQTLLGSGDIQLGTGGESDIVDISDIFGRVISDTLTQTDVETLTQYATDGKILKAVVDGLPLLMTAIYVETNIFIVSHPILMSLDNKLAFMQILINTATYKRDTSLPLTYTIVDIDTLDSKLTQKVSGTGVTQIQAVTALPESPADGVLYIITAAEETEETV